MRVPWTARRSNESILKEINPAYSLERPTLKLKLQYFGPLMLRADSLEKTLMLERLTAGGEGLSEEDYLTTEDKTVGRHHRPNEHESEQTLGDSEGQGNLVPVVQGVTKSQTLMSD